MLVQPGDAPETVIAGARKVLGAKGARAAESVPVTVMAGARNDRGENASRAAGSVPLMVMTGVRKARPAAGVAGLAGVEPEGGLTGVVMTGGFWTGGGVCWARAEPASNAANPAAANRPLRMVSPPQIDRKLTAPERLSQPPAHPEASAGCGHLSGLFARR